MKTKITFVVIGMVTAIILTSARAATWTRKTDMPTARHWVHTCVVDRKIYAIGALQPFNQLSKVEAYDPATDTWTEKADMPTPRTWIDPSVVCGKIYVVGGESYWHGPTLAIVEAYDPTTDRWTRKADMLGSRSGFSTSAVNGKLYVMGGSDYDYGPDVSTVEMYDPVTDAWTRKADMPTARLIPNTCVVDGLIYVFGGQTEEGTTAPYAAVEVYDPVTDTWARRGDMPWPRTVSSSSVVNNMIYCFGGRAVKAGVPLSTVLQYDPATDIWTAKGAMPARIAGMGTSAVGGKIYVIGGSSQLSLPFNEVLSTVWEYDTGLDAPSPDFNGNCIVESDAPSPDFNGNGIVDSADVSILVDHWHTDNELYDVAPLPFGDSFVDVQDLIFLSEHLFEEVDDPTLVAHWALDEAEGILAADSVSENGFTDGVVMGDPLWQPTGGQVNGAIQLDGVDDYIITNPILNPADGSFSIFAWVRGGAPGQVIISQADVDGQGPLESGSTWLGIDPADGRLMTGLMDIFFGPLESESVVTDGQWHHVGLVYDITTIKRHLYVDRAEVAVDVVAGVKSTAGLYIGAGQTLDASTFFSGLIDDVRIYNRVVNP